MATININFRKFTSGESYTDDVPDRGFSPSSIGLNLTKERGKLYFREADSELNTAPGKPIVAFTRDPEVLGEDLFAVDQDGGFYTIDGTTVINTVSGANNYQDGTSDIFVFKNKVYATSENAIAQLDSSLGSLVENWWSGLSGSYRHPIERIEDEMFIANGNEIYYWNGSSSGIAFSLPDGQAVTSLQRYPDGRTLLAFTSGDRELNLSHTKSSGGYVYFLNPTLRGFDREIRLPTQVEGSILSNGVTFVTYGDTFGYFTIGGGLRPLTKLRNASYLYSNKLDEFEDIIVFADGQNIRAYGDLGAGNVFWNMYHQGTYDLTAIAYQGDNKLITSRSNSGGTGEITQIDYDNSGNIGTFYSNKFDFSQEVSIDKIVLLHDTSASGGITKFDLYEVGLSGSLTLIESVSHSNVSANRTEIRCGGIKRDIFQFSIQPTNDDIGYYSIQIHYEPIR